jgi:tetratricopeptide (TPR) repeat protein
MLGRRSVTRKHKKEIYTVMSNRRTTLGILVLLFTFAAVALADQPKMVAARIDLVRAKTQLQAALANKAGHRAKAIESINAAIVEINKGMAFDRRNNHARTQLEKELTLVSSTDQPRMQQALDYLQRAKTNLEAANSDKGGHRMNAIRYVEEAIDQVKKGMAAGE